MKFKECVCALFSYMDYTFPEGEFRIKISDKKYHLNSKKVVLLRTKRFKVNEELEGFYNTLKSNKEYFVQRFPYSEEWGILLNKEYFTIFLKNYSKNDEMEKRISNLIDSYYCIYIILEYNYDGEKENVIEYIKKLRDEKSDKNVKQVYFSVIDEFYKYIIILRSPFINITDINYRNIDGMFSFCCWEDYTLITEARYFRFDYYEPKIDESKYIQEFFDKEEIIPIEDFFMAKAKVYERLHNYSMSIIHAVIALEIVVPKFINEHLRSKGVNSESIQDFDNKFGLSVRVKAILKIILPEKFHDDITKVGTIINFRNKIMHKGITNDFFREINVKELIDSSESLIMELKKGT